MSILQFADGLQSGPREVLPDMSPSRTRGV